MDRVASNVRVPGASNVRVPGKGKGRKTNAVDRKSDTSSSSSGSGSVISTTNINNNTQKKLCSCLGTRHGHITNCTNCGYIICRFEVTEQQSTSSVGELISCPNCNEMCTPPYSAQQVEAQKFDETTVKAYKQKDTLLQYDKEHAKRTIVRDAQADYYVSSAWLTDEERKEMELKERQRLEMKKHARRNKKINIRFDIAGRKIVEAHPYDEQEEDSSEITVCRPELDEVDIGSCNNVGTSGITEDEISFDVSPVFENCELMMRTSKAAEVYRHMRKRYVKQVIFISCTKILSNFLEYNLVGNKILRQICKFHPVNKYEGKFNMTECKSINCNKYNHHALHLFSILEIETKLFLEYGHNS
jgi:hypothetical protein